jgi:hypothetical protein
MTNGNYQPRISYPYEGFKPLSGTGKERNQDWGEPATLAGGCLIVFRFKDATAFLSAVRCKPYIEEDQ